MPTGYRPWSLPYNQERAEDTRDVVLSRGAAAGGDCGRIHVVRPALDDMLGLRPRPATEERLLLPRDLSRLRDLVERTGARLLIIDPLVAFLDGLARQ